MKIDVTVLYDNQLDTDSINQLIELNHNVNLSFVSRKNLSIPNEVLIIAFELIKNLSYSASYDIIKAVVLSIIAKIKQTPTRKAEVIIVSNKKKHKLSFSYDLSDEQKDKLVDAAIAYLLDD